MPQILDSLCSTKSGQILCSYANITDQVQIARITNIPGWYFERVVFPQEYLLFEALPDAQLEIYSSGNSGDPLLWDTRACDRLQVWENNTQN